MRTTISFHREFLLELTNILASIIRAAANQKHKHKDLPMDAGSRKSLL